ncbi:ferredoxin--NADP reductase [Mycobacterium sp. URHB0044]|jgi:3-ketosteroid 9alpha-monooxygenase subunit B|uniref:ferredoxin--NADP reductase n=1 Tax=Mycobacterium sp. URHB0044 TaxID=1380386 RepID=UPI000A42610F|nr:ferredoxin--NADP reductase [Mycobacterium sp. URHB0044]
MFDTPIRSRSMLLVVNDVIEETADARSLVFGLPEDRPERLAYRPGQFLTLRIPSDATGSVARCYSLASSPHVDPAPKVTVKRTAGGYGSNWLCDNVTVGDHVEVLPPSGAFSPGELDRDFLLWAGGSGITPVMSILKSALTAGSGEVVLLYANRDERSVIFGDELRALTAVYPRRLSVMHWLESVQGLPSGEQLAAFAAHYDGFESYVCGPGPFMATVHDALSAAGVPRGHVHAEVFSSLAGDPFDAPAPTPDDVGDAATVEVSLDGRRHTVRWPRNRSLVDAMLAVGIDVPYSCQEGRCGSCACTVVAGRVDMPPSDILGPDDLQAGLVLGCQARPVTDEITIEF